MNHAKFVLLVGIVLCISAFTTSAASDAKFQGQLFQGIGTETIARGGTSFNVQLIEGTFAKGLTDHTIKNLLQNSFLSASTEPSCWNSVVDEMFEKSTITMSSHRKVLRVVLGSANGYNCTNMEVVSTHLPPPLLQNHVAVDGPKFLVVPDGRLSFDVDGGWGVTSATTNLIFSGPDRSHIEKGDYKIVSGTDCRGTRAVLADPPRWENVTSKLSIVPLQGGIISVCYNPSVDHPLLSVKAKGTAIVSGPEGFVSDSPNPRAQIEFKANVYGTNLTSQDLLLFTEEPCATAVDASDVYDITLSSPSRAVCYVTIPSDGVYNVCYLRSGSPSYTHVTSIIVQKGGDVLIEEDSTTLTVTEDSLVVRPVHVQFLTVGGGTLSLEGHTMNVSHFTWSDGFINGGGIINCMKTNSRIEGASRSIVLDSIIHNFGAMQIDLRYLSLSGSSLLINSGELTIMVNSTRDDPAMLSCQSAKNHILNSVGGRIKIVFFGDEGSLLVSCPIINKGRIVLTGRSRIILRAAEMYEGSSLKIATNTHLGFESGNFRGIYTVENNAELRFFEGLAHLRSARFSGSGTISIGSPRVIIDSIEVTGAMRIFIRGDTSPNDIEVYGFNTFDEKTTLAMGNTKFLSKGTVSHLLVGGQLLCHIPSVEFKDNVVVHAQLTAVMFGVGEKGVKHANLIPQRLPQNASFIVPPNATLVIMDTGNRTQQELTDTAALPKVCAYYLVVPMHVEVSGKVMLWGCAILPFGGTTNGLVFGADAEDISASVEYAFCKNVLANPNVCVPVFPTEEARPVSGIAVGGDHAFTSGLPELPSIDVDYMEVMPNGRMSSTNALRILARNGVMVHSSSALALTHGGFVASKKLTINGLIDVSSSSPLSLNTAVDVGPRGTVKVAAEGTCSYPMSVTEAIRFAHGSAIECSAHLNLTEGESFPVIQTDQSIEGTPVLDRGTCGVKSTFAMVLSNKHLGFRVDEESQYPSIKGILLGCLAALITSILLFVALGFRISPDTFLTELKRKTDVPLQLSFPEFSSYVRNYLAIGSILLDAAFLTSTAFHPLIPLPVIANFFVHTSTYTMLLHLTSGSKHVLLIVVLVAVILWGIVWLPLVGKKISEKMKSVLYETEKESHRYAIQLLFQFHTTASVFALAAFIPILSYIMDPVACSTVLSESQACVQYQRLFGPCLAGSAMFAYLAPYSANCNAFPFGHPPYQKDLDVRYKRTYIFVQYTIYFLQIWAWKVFATTPLALLICSLILVSVLFGLTLLSSPCAYTNINTIKSMSYLYPQWAIVCGLVQIMRFGSHPQFVCAVTDPLYVILLVSGFCIISIGMISSLRRCVRPVEEGAEGPLAIHLHSLMHNYAKIEQRKMEMYNTENSREREKISDNISALRIQYLQLLNAYRRKKERFLLPYYLGDSLGGQLANAQVDDDPNTPKFDIPMTTICTNDAEEEELLSTDQMEGFVRGPPLGRGSYGIVHMGMLSSGKLVAVKEIPISRKKKGVLANVKKEVDVLRSLVHPNVIRYYGCHVTLKQMSVFMEFAVGGSLTSLIRKFEKLSESTIRQYTVQILRGLAYLHSKNIIHRDIKGENILIDGAGVAKLADFGCSKGLADISNKSQQGCATLVGSPYFMAPEVIKESAYGTKADIWSLACTVVEMLNGGHPPWHEKFDNVYSAMFFIGSTTELPSNIPSDVTDLCKDFLSRCFERNVSKRASAIDLLKHPWLHAAQQKSSPQISEDSPLNPRQWSDMFETSTEGTGTGRTTLEATTAATTMQNTHTEEPSSPGMPTSGEYGREFTDSMAHLRSSPIQ